VDADKADLKPLKARLVLNDEEATDASVAEDNWLGRDDIAFSYLAASHRGI